MLKMKCNFRKYHIFKDMRFLQRMMLIYVIGGIIPLLGASIYTNSQTRKMMVDLYKETQSEELSLVAASINESMSVLDNVSDLLCKNEDIQRMAKKKYSSSSDFFKDYYNLSAISEYLNYYQQDISYINIYLKNNSIKMDDINNTKNIFYLEDSIQEKDWYKKTVTSGDLGYWYYGTPPDSKKKLLQVSRAVRTDSGKVIAVVVVYMQEEKTQESIYKRDTDTMLMYNDTSVISANYDADNAYPFLRDSLSQSYAQAFSKKMVYGVEEYLVAYEQVQPRNSRNYYSLVSIQKYQQIMANVNRISLQAFLPEMIGMVVSVSLIIGFAISFGRRMNQISQQMHYVAQGEYEKVEPIEGSDEIGELYQELEQMMKGIQMLMEQMVEEQVQKEKLHTRQKEVEFKMLASQINPHFLYNTLETIRMKAMVNKQPEIAELVMMLAKTMRYHIQVTDQLVLLGAEIQMVEYYLKIQEYRFGDRITSRVEVEPDVDMNALIMPLVIQPFVENAFVHGLEEKDSDGKLVVRIKMQKEDIQIVVWDNGVGMDYFELGQLRKSMHEENADQTHIGVRNVNQRIRILYGERYGVQVESQKGIGTKVTIRFPYRLSEDD